MEFLGFPVTTLEAILLIIASNIVGLIAGYYSRRLVPMKYRKRLGVK